MEMTTEQVEEVLRDCMRRRAMDYARDLAARGLNHDEVVTLVLKFVDEKLKPALGAALAQVLMALRTGSTAVH